MLKIKKREKILIYAAAAVISIFVINKVFVSAARSGMSSLKSRIAGEEAKLRMGVEFQKRKEALVDEYKGYKEYLKKEKLPEADLFAKFLKEVENIARESRVSILSLNPQNKAEESDGYRKYTADLRMEATPEQFYDFLSRIQKSSLLLKIDKMSVTAKDESGGALRVEMLISIAIL